MARESSQAGLVVRRPKNVTDTAHVVLIDKHADMRAAFERFGNFHWRIKIG